MVKTPGLLVPPLTPFTDDLKIDYEVLRRQIDDIIENARPSAITAAGVEAQEYHYLSWDDRQSLVRRTVEFVDGRCPVMVGISDPNFRRSIQLAHLAEELKADVAQLLAPLRPFGGAPDLDDLTAYFQAVARETRLPLLLYINPGPGADVSIEATIKLCQIEQVKYVKESSRDMTRIGRLINEVDHAGGVKYFTTMQVLLPTLMLGGAGATMPPPGAMIARKVIDAYERGDYAQAAKHQYEFTLFPARWSRHGLTPSLKAAMKIVGRPVGDPYPPFHGLTEAEYADMEKHLRAHSSLFA